MIKVFVASSSELAQEREKLAGVVQKMNGWLHDRGAEERVYLEKWEYLESSMGVDHNRQKMPNLTIN